MGLAAGLSVVSAACTLLVSEPYPSLTGPLFWGQRADATGLSVVRSVITVEDATGERSEILAAGLYGVPQRFAFNLVAFQFPVE